MIILIRFALIALCVWGLWKLVIYLLAATSKTEACPRCEGEGSWLGTRERVQCKNCSGTGRILKVGR